MLVHPPEDVTEEFFAALRRDVDHAFFVAPYAQGTLALLAAGVAKDDPVVKSALRHLRTLGKPKMVYTTSLQTMVLCAADAEANDLLIRRNALWLQQSQITVGSGGLFGRGLTNSLAGQNLPVGSTDFVFAHVSEQLGFLGGSVVLALFALLIWRVLLVGCGTSGKTSTADFSKAARGAGDALARPRISAHATDRIIIVSRSASWLIAVNNWLID